MDNISVASEGPPEDGVQYFSATMGTDSGPNEDHGYHYWVSEEDALLTPSAVLLTDGADRPLRSSDQSAHIHVIGNQ